MKEYAQSLLAEFFPGWLRSRLFRVRGGRAAVAQDTLLPPNGGAAANDGNISAHEEVGQATRTGSRFQSTYDEEKER
jgi:hypothetical protein